MAWWTWATRRIRKSLVTASAPLWSRSISLMFCFQIALTPHCAGSTCPSKTIIELLFRTPKTSWKPFCLSRIAFYSGIFRLKKHSNTSYKGVSQIRGPPKSTKISKTSGFPFKHDDHDVFEYHPPMPGEGSADSKVGSQRVGQRRWRASEGRQV